MEGFTNKISTAQPNIAYDKICVGGLVHEKMQM
jgi:hypothetical protein